MMKFSSLFPPDSPAYVVVCGNPAMATASKAMGLLCFSTDSASDTRSSRLVADILEGMSTWELTICKHVVSDSQLEGKRLGR